MNQFQTTYPFENLYSEVELANDDNYISTHEAIQYFPWLKSEKTSHRRVQGYVESGQLLGRCFNLGSLRNNHWQVFVPDIERFKKSKIKKI